MDWKASLIAKGLTSPVARTLGWALRACRSVRIVWEGGVNLIEVGLMAGENLADLVAELGVRFSMSVHRNEPRSNTNQYDQFGLTDKLKKNNQS